MVFNKGKGKSDMRMSRVKNMKKITTAVLLVIMCLGLVIPEDVKSDTGFRGELFSKPSTI